MLNQNFVTLEGNMTRDPEIKEAGSSQVSNFGIAVNKRIKKADGTWTNTEPQFFEVSAWGFDAEASMQLSKGDAVIIIGELSYQQWEKDGQKRNAVRIIARSLGKKLRRVTSDGASATAPADEEIPF